MKRSFRTSCHLLLALLVMGGAAACEPAGSAPSVVRVSTADQLVRTYATAAPGTTIELAAGTYAPKQLRRPASSEELIKLRATPGAQVEVRDLDVRGPLAVERLTLTGIIRFRAEAAGSSLSNSTVRPGNVIVEGDRVSILDNDIQGPPDRDALDIGATDGTGPFGVQVRGNTLGPGTLSPGSTAHVDCLQVMSGEDLVVADNLLYDCPAQTLLVKSDLGPIRNVTVVRNALRGCRPRTDACPAWMTLQVVSGPHPMRDIVIEGNTIAGALRMTPGIAGLVARGNAASSVEQGCEYLTSGNVVGTARCTVPPGNTVADPRFIDVDAAPPDLRPAQDSPSIDRGGAAQTQRDAKGRSAACGSGWDAGAYERCD